MIHLCFINDSYVNTEGNTGCAGNMRSDRASEHFII